MSTPQYYVTVDSQFRDSEKYPLDTDFGVSFQTKNPNANYPQGLPVDPTSVFPRISIDKNFDSIGIQVKGGSITEYSIDEATGDILFSGVTAIPTDNTPNDFLILYNDFILYSFLGAIVHSTPFLCRLSANGIPKWCIMLKQKPQKQNTTLDSTFKLINNSGVYFMFDYTLSSGLNEATRKTDFIYFESCTYSTFDPSSNTNVMTITTLNYPFENYYTNYLYNVNTEQTPSVIGIFAFDSSGNPLQLNGHPWGYQQFAMNTYYYGQLFDMLPTNTNGRNVLTVDKGNNIYAGIHVNPFTISLQTNELYTTTPYYKADLLSIKKPIYYAMHTSQEVQTPSFGNIVLQPTTSDNVLVYYLGCSSPSTTQDNGADSVGLLKLNIHSPTFQTVDRGLEVDLLPYDPMNVGTFIPSSGNRPLCLIGDNNDPIRPITTYNTGTIYTISGYQYIQNPSVSNQGNGLMTLDTQFRYNGVMTDICTVSGTGSSVEFTMITTSDINQYTLYTYTYNYTGPGNSSLLLNATATVSGYPLYDYESYNTKVTSWKEGDITYVAYILRGDRTNTLATFNTIFINTVNYSSGAYQTPSESSILNIKKGYITDFQSFTIGATVFLIAVSDNITYVFKRNYIVSSEWKTIIIPNNAHYIIPKIKEAGLTYTIYLVGSNMILNTSNVYTIPYDYDSYYYYKIGGEYRFASGQNAVVSIVDNGVVSLGRTIQEGDVYHSTCNVPRGFTFQDKIVDAQHVYFNNSYVSVLPTENLNKRPVTGLTTLTIGEVTYLFTLRYEVAIVTTINIDIFYMDGFTPVFITNYSFTRTSGDYVNPDFSCTFIPNGTLDNSGIPYGQDSVSSIGEIIVLVGPNKQSLQEGVYIASFTIETPTVITFNSSTLVDVGVSVYNSWIYKSRGVYYLVNNITDLVSPSSFSIYTIDYKYRIQYLTSQLFFSPIYITSGEIYYNYTDPSTRKNTPVLICYYSTSSISPGYWGIVTLLPSVDTGNMLLNGGFPSFVRGFHSRTYVSIARNGLTNDYAIAAISWKDYTFLLNIQDNGTVRLSIETIGGKSVENYETVSVVWNPNINRLFTTSYSQTNNNIANMYDVTLAGTDTDIITLSAQIDLESILEYNNYVSNTSPYILYSSISNQSVILFTNYLAYKKIGPAAGSNTSFPEFPTLITYDLSNPVFSNLYQTPTKVSANMFAYGNGNAILVKLQNDGQKLWNTSLGDSIYVSSVLDSQYVNINQITLDSTELNLYTTLNWKTKCSVVDYNTTQPSQNITNPFRSYSSQGAAFLKIRGDIGSSIFLIPIVGGNDTFPIGCNPISSTSFAFGLSTVSSITYIYERQLAGTIANPNVIQNVVNTLSLENSHVLSIDNTGVLVWTSSIQSDVPNTSIVSYGFHTYNGESFLVSKGNNLCYIVDASKVKKQTIYQFPQTSSQYYILITRFDEKGLYKESDTIESPVDMPLIPELIYTSDKGISISTSSYQQNINFADLWIRNKDGSIGSIEMLPEENLYYTKTVYSTPGNYIVSSPSGCIGSVVKLWGAGGDAGRFRVSGTDTVGGYGGGGAFSSTFINPEYTSFAIKVGSHSKGGSGGGELSGIVNNGQLGSGFGGAGGEASWVAVDAVNPTGSIEGNFMFYAIAGGGGGGSYNYLTAGGPGGNYPQVNIGSMGNYGQNGIGGTPNPDTALDSKGVNCPLHIQNTYPYFYTLTGSFGKGGTGSLGCGGGGNGFGGGAGGNMVTDMMMLEPTYNGGAGGGIYGYVTLTSNGSNAANTTDIDYIPGIGNGGTNVSFTGGNGYAVVYSFFYSSTGYIYGQAPAYTGINSTYVDGTMINYKYNASYTDANGNNYSKLTCYSTSGPMFNPYHTTGAFLFSTGTTGTNLIGKYVYIKGDDSDAILNRNFSIRESYFNSITKEYSIILNSKIDTSGIVRVFQEVNNNSLSQYFYTSNVAQSLTTAILSYQTGSGNTVIISDVYPFNPSQTYYILTPVNKITNITGIVHSNGFYYLTVDTLANLAGNTWITITPFNRSALYTLQFYPSSISTPLYYKVSLQYITIPNRRIRNSPYSGYRELSDFPYLLLEIYNTSDNGTYDPQIVNTFYSNDPNKDGRAIFTIPITSAGGESNYLFLNGAGNPKVKFTPGYYNIRFRLLDPYGNLVQFDNTPYKSSDVPFEGSTVDPRLMNVVVDMSFSPV